MKITVSYSFWSRWGKNPDHYRRFWNMPDAEVVFKEPKCSTRRP